MLDFFYKLFGGRTVEQPIEPLEPLPDDVEIESIDYDVDESEYGPEEPEEEEEEEEEPPQRGFSWNF